VSLNRALLLLIIGLTAPIVTAQSDKEIDLLCEKILCRPPGTTVRLLLDNGTPFETRFDGPSPIVQAAFLNIFPGETLNIEAEVQGDRLVSLKAVESITKPSQTLVLKMWQQPGKPDTYFRITNPFPATIKYRAGMMLPDREDLLKTSSCPVMSNGGSAFEHWPQTIFQLVLADFRVLPSTAEASCN